VKSLWQEHASGYQNALLALTQTPPNGPILELIDEVCETTRPIILTGYGASLIVAEKATHHLRSIGISAVALHPSDAEHGDLGIVAQESLIIVVSKSGKLDALTNVLRVASDRNCSIYVLTEGHSSRSHTKVPGQQEIKWITVSPSREADRFGIVPTVSVVKQLVVLDFIVEQASKKLNKSTDDFLSNHPSGNLGRYLNLSIREYISRDTGSLPFNQNVSLSDVLGTIESSKKGICVFLTESSRIYGLLTEGDIRRLVLKHGISTSLDDADVTKFINRTPRVIYESDSVAQAWTLLRTEPAVSTLVAIDSDDTFVGILHARDLQP
jgi:arabinose-5-phosphate isomerase